MRMWMVDPRIMCTRHLVAEHLETHMIAGSVKKGKNLQGFFDKGEICLDKLQERHDVLVAEMESRGMKHKSPFVPVEGLTGGHVDAKESEHLLLTRCAECRKRKEELGL